MDSSSVRQTRVLWSFWIACGLAVTGGLAPLLLAAGGTNRIAGAVIPFGVAAVAMGVNALMYQQGRPLATALYFIASLALVYGMLSIVAVPLRLAVLGTCTPSETVTCGAGHEAGLTSGESTGLAVAIAMGTLAIFVGFFGLLMLYRMPAQVFTPPPARRIDETPPVRRDSVQVPPPVAPAHETPPPAAEPEPAISAPSPQAAVPPPPPSAPARAPRKPRAKRAPKPQAELPPPEEPLELPAPEEPLELPAPQDTDEPPPRPST